MRFQYDSIGERFVESKTTAAFSAADTHTLLGALDALGGVRGLDTLDLACGYGYNTRLLARGGARRAVGVDISEEMIRLARAHGVIGADGVGALEGAVGAVLPVRGAGAVAATGAAADTGAARGAAARAEGAPVEAAPVEAAPAQAAPVEAASIEYLVADAAKLPQMGPFDLATAVYLFNYATDRSALHAMFRSIRANLRDGGRLLAIVPNAGAYPNVDWSPYGVRIVDRVHEGDAPLLKAQFLTQPPADFEFREWAHSDFAEAAVEAGFSTVGWQPNRTPPADGARDEAYWTAYRAWPISSLMTCTA
ncbi:MULTISPECIES: class I SAM-dependent methyltransferase [unclassified Streptomyces]|uniref:class I SAM-dependent methyltransferase n=1 Tax=unclassified Streptomyces TaxID=2593676 RepID=UPI0022531DE3|nr:MULTISPECIES: class I SAM-dependent methyltransferase [unclassified Streptomyces]MCX5149290.1 class I SAM-dependent methyltransferase [Streptomyces sp. NBC_00320]WSN52349.1 class I SAM-dependent methyltransferase [Streptomyces sp. NBC_01296]WSW58146.1 class I SAM-dependent methyltransferase [Streptomyces sp. NBC_00998]